MRFLKNEKSVFIDNWNRQSVVVWTVQDAINNTPKYGYDKMLKKQNKNKKNVNSMRVSFFSVLLVDNYFTLFPI